MIEGHLDLSIMNRVIIRLYIVKTHKEYNVIFDSSFSFNENLKVLSGIIDYDFSNCHVYDNKLNMFINKDIALFNYNIPSSRVYYIY